MEDFADWELVRSLELQGFEMQIAPQKKAQRIALLPLCSSAQRRVWYCAGVDLSRCRSYLQCLLRASELFATSPDLKICHLQAATYYKSIVSGEDSNGLLALEHDDDHAEDELPALELDVDMPAAPALMRSEPDQLIRRREGMRQNVLRVVRPLGAVQPDELAASDDNDNLSPQLSHASDSEDRAWAQLHDNDEHVDGLANAAKVERLPENRNGQAEEADVFDEIMAVVAASAVPSASDDAAMGVPESEYDDDGVMLSSLLPASEELPAAKPTVAAKPTAPRVPAVPPGSIVRVPDPDSAYWGPFFLTWSNPDKRPPAGAWQARCPFHKLNATTACTKSINAASTTDADKLAAKKKLMSWCLTAATFSRKRDHGAVQTRFMDALPLPALDAQLTTLPLPPAILKTDVDLDAEAATQGEVEDVAPAAKKPPRGKKRPRSVESNNPGASVSAAGPDPVEVDAGLACPATEDAAEVAAHVESEIAAPDFTSERAASHSELDTSELLASDSESESSSSSVEGNRPQVQGSSSSNSSSSGSD